MTSDSRIPSNGSNALPLFRPEAILYQQQKSYGEIILIRPLSLTLLTWLSLAIVAGVVGFFVFGRYTEKVHLPGRIVAAEAASAGGFQAELAVPERWLKLVQPGARVKLRCRACSPEAAEQTGTVTGVAASYPGSTQRGTYKIMVSLPPQAAQGLQLNPSQPGAQVEAEIPVGRKPFIQWFFERSGS
jgi:hypothetical protein